MKVRSLGLLAAVLLLPLCSCKKERRAKAPPALEALSFRHDRYAAVRELSPEDAEREAEALGGSPFRARRSRAFVLTASGSDSVHAALFEFERDYEAFAVLHFLEGEPAGSSPLVKRLGAQVLLGRGPFLALFRRADFSALPLQEAREILTGFLADSLAPGLPRIFAGFPEAGRLGGSERVFFPFFLGRKVPSPVFSVAVECGADTAFLFRSGDPGFSPLPPSLAAGARPGGAGALKSLDLATGERVTWQADAQSVWGVVGCPDDREVVKWVKILEKMAFLSQDP